jgi:protein-tyrosine-phosphatase
MPQDSVIIFVCEHGAAKSVLAATYFNHIAQKTGSNLRAIARGTDPHIELSPQMIKGLSEDGLVPAASVPQKITEADVRSAQRVIAFCELPIEYEGQGVIECWDDIPPVSENYTQTRDIIVERIRQMLKD